MLVGVLALAGVRALMLCDLPVLLFVVFAAAVLAYAARDVAGHGGTLLGRDEQGRWHLARPGDRPFSGRLAEAGYRGAAFVVLVIDTDDDAGTGAGPDRRGWPFRRRRHVTVFADSVSPRDFSRLHLELALAAGDDPADGASRRR